MVFTTTSTKRRAAAFTFVELMVAIGISSLVFAALASFTLYSGKSFAAIYHYVDMEQKSQIAIDTMSREVRGAQYLTSYNTNSITLLDNDGALLTFSWSPVSRALVRVKNSQVKTLLRECDSMRFDLWQRTPISGTWSNYTTSTLTNAKVINVNWRCSRKILGKAMTTESVQTSKIVIRNK